MSQDVPSPLPAPSPIISYTYEGRGGDHHDSSNPVDAKTIILAVVLSFITIGTILGNLSVLIIFFTKLVKKARGEMRSMISPTHYFIANLAVADFLVGVLVLPFLTILQVTGKWHFGPYFCTIWICTHFWLCAASILSTCAICIERFIGVRYPIQHMRILTHKKIVLSLCLVWIMAGIPSLVRVFAWTEAKMEGPNQCTSASKVPYSILTSAWIFYVPALIMMILYFRIYRVALKHMNSVRTGIGRVKNGGLAYRVSKGRGDTRNHSSVVTSVASIGSSVKGSRNNEDTELGESQTAPTPLTPEVKPKRKTEDSGAHQQINLARKLAVLVGVIIISYGPYFTLILLKSINCEWVNVHVFDVFAWMRYFNSFLNPFIYAYAVPLFGRAFRKNCFNCAKKMKPGCKR